MSKSTIAIAIYIIGLIFGALFLDLWSAETSPKAFIGIIWTALLLIALFYSEKNEKK
jgi:formate hydrogenlyase subunit 4